MITSINILQTLWYFQLFLNKVERRYKETNSSQFQTFCTQNLLIAIPRKAHSCEKALTCHLRQVPFSTILKPLGDTIDYYKQITCGWTGISLKTLLQFFIKNVKMN